MSEISASKQKIFIVEDDELVREAYQCLIEEEPDLEVCGQASTASAAIEEITNLYADLLVVDISLPDVSGLALVSHMKKQRPELPALVISGHDPAIYLGRAFDAGARGYLDKKMAATALTDAIRQVLKGELYVGDRQA